jgi:hypothetical protein
VGVTALPADMQTALAQGRLTAADARAWVGISKNALLCKLATAMPSVRDKLVGAHPYLRCTSTLACALRTLHAFSMASRSLQSPRCLDDSSQRPALLRVGWLLRRWGTRG